MPVTTKRRLSFFIVLIVMLIVCVIAILGFMRYAGNETAITGPAKLMEKAGIKPGPAPTVFDWQPALEVYAGAADVDSSDFSDPYGIAIDKSGNIYVSDAGEHNQIMKISRDGAITALAGSAEGFADGQGAQAAFNTPSGMVIDGKGNLLVADTANHAIRCISADGVVTTVAGNGKPGYQDGPAGQAQFNGPVGVTVDKTGNIYVADTYNDRIRKISTDGQVSTVAGGALSGYLDGPAATAQFDTPTGITVNSKGDLLIADSRNNAIRRLSADGQVSSVLHTLAEEEKPLMQRPLSIVATYDDHLYIGEGGKGRIIQISPAGEMRGVTGVGIEFTAGDDSVPRLAQATGIALNQYGSLLVADSARLQVMKIRVRNGRDQGKEEIKPTAPTPLAGVHNTRADERIKSYPWPVKSQQAPHEVVGTIGEVRGNYNGESRDHFHAGLDVQANMGTLVYAIADEKMRGTGSTWGYDGLSEGIKLDSMAYIHIKVGRSAKNQVLDEDKFQVQTDSEGKPYAMRVRRGTRFKTGEVLGSINRMFHVHLEHNHAGTKVNPLALNFPGFVDTTRPQIEDIQILDGTGAAIKQKQNGKLLLSKTVTDYSIVVDAYDQADGNAKRRRLGIYQLGYQILHADSSPVAGFEKPLINMEFNALPPDREMVQTAYAEASGITVHGAKKTRFLYVATNTVRDGVAKQGNWDVSKLVAGDYILRIHAADFAGNVARDKRDLAFRVE
ncbi:gluconolaconase [Undibacterium sp. TS12]|uniref:gluconolaconase n=1 Tax=Undibacterium sp. TS12 TaxID=2908202 RepID=UPI001F4CB76D|nr:gluconolaconase [Undibacterium sp. TS12]MCH8623069.1 gluconolaconase [Undibacterium sp. TS12]